MKSMFGQLAGTALVVGALGATAAPAPVYENRNEVSTPMVDATIFLNRGAFHVSTSLAPYVTQNTLYFTNFAGATIDGSAGFHFENSREDGSEGWASSFANYGNIGFDVGFSGFSFGTGFSTAGLESTWLQVDATNILNRGGLSVGSAGLIHLRGSAVDLSRSGLRAGEDPFAPITPGFISGNLYSNERGVQDLYWGAGQNNVLDPNGAGPFDLTVLTGNPPSSDFHEVLDDTTLTNLVSLSATNVFARTNAINATNWVVQAVFVNTNTTDPNFKIDVKFGAPRRPSVPGAMMPIVRFTFEDIDTITTEPYTNYVYLLDNHGGMTNSILITNRSNFISQRPSNFILTRVTPPEWARGQTSNVAYKPDLLYNANYAGQTVTNWYSGYSAQIGSLPGATLGGGFSLGGAGGGGVFGEVVNPTHPTNSPGRIQIEADRLDLSLARFRSEGLLSVKAKELVGTAPYKLDSTAVSIEAGLSSSPLVVSNLVQPEVRRFVGTVSAYSAIWTNQTFSTAPDPATPGTLITNTVDVRFHVLIVEHNFITRVPVDTYRFAAKSAGFQLVDDLTVRESFRVDSPTVDLLGSVSLGTNSISADTFPNTVALTNHASLSTSADIALGSASRPIPSIDNPGFISGQLVDVFAGTYSQSGFISSSVGNLTLDAAQLLLTGGQSTAAANLVLRADALHAVGTTLNAGYEAKNFNSGNTNYFLGSLLLDIGEHLVDGGAEATNFWTVYDGFSMPRHPAMGDLLGTVMTSKVNRFAEAVHTWAGLDQGAVAAGFKDNAALGRLVLDGRPFSLFTFRAPSTNAAALYVDYLELANYATNLDLALNVEPGFKIYFADSNIPAETLNGASGGRIQWVQDFAGHGSGAPVTLGNGKTVVVNRALLRSRSVDSDGDGVVNALDSAPFEPAALKVNVRLVGSSPSKAEVSWLGNPGSNYRVEYSSRLDGTGWQTLTTAASPSESSGAMSVTDSLAAPSEQRFYRVVEVR